MMTLKCKAMGEVRISKVTLRPGFEMVELYKSARLKCVSPRAFSISKHSRRCR